jgi:ribosome-associated protein
MRRATNHTVPSTKQPTPKKAAAKKATKTATKTTTTKRAAVIPKAFRPVAEPKAVKKAAVKKAAKKTAKPAPSVPSTATVADVNATWLLAAKAADAKKATNIKVIDLREITTFADFFIICSGGSSRQTQAIANEVETELKKVGERPNSVEGYGNGEWVLLDYGDIVVHVFTEQARTYYDLDRLWRDGKEVAHGLLG